MNRQRLEKLRDYLRDNVKDERFNLSTWAGNDQIPWQGNTDLSCGTTACAMGWATTIPEFREAGLTLRKNYGFPNMGEVYYRPNESRLYHGFSAAAKFLDISTCDAAYLFAPEMYPNESITSKNEVIDRIDQYLIDND